MHDVEEKFKANEKLVWDVIHKMNCEPNEDLYQIGSIGLINAIKQFDESKGFKFSTYASTCIRNEILRSFRGKKVSTVTLTPFVLNNTIDGDIESTYDHSKDLLNVINGVLQEKMTGLAIDLFMNYYRDIAEGKIPMKQSDMAKQLGVSQRTVCRYLKKINNDIINRWR